jgi:hypothetical protein
VLSFNIEIFSSWSGLASRPLAIFYRVSFSMLLKCLRAPVFLFFIVRDFLSWREWSTSLGKIAPHHFALAYLERPFFPSSMGCFFVLTGVKHSPGLFSLAPLAAHVSERTVAQWSFSCLKGRQSAFSPDGFVHRIFAWTATLSFFSLALPKTLMMPRLSLMAALVECISS